MPKNFPISRSAVVGVIATATAISAAAQQTPPVVQAVSEGTLGQVVVTGTVDPLDRRVPTASRLGITARETPASIDAIDAETMAARGYSSAERAVDSMPGVSSGGTPGSPSQFSMRGFTGNQITVLRDGFYLGPASMTYRSQNTFNLSGIEVLKGPGSVLYGQGAIAGTVNVITKKPVIGENSGEGILSVGSFGTRQIGVGGNFALGAGANTDTAMRIDLSRTSSHGFIDDTRSDSTNLTMAVRWAPSARFDAQVSLDVLHDNPTPYWGTPLVPASATATPLSGVVSSTRGLTVDSRTRDLNYNVSDYRISSTQYLPRLTLRWKPADDITVTSETYYLHADRKWQNAESYAFDTASGRVDRDRFFVFHDQKLFGSQLSAAFSHPLAGLGNRFVVGIDYSKLDFTRTRGFPDGDSVDLLAPAGGSFGPLVGRRSPTRWNDTAVFVEDALNVTKALKLVTGARYEQLKLDRENYGPDGAFQPASSFSRTFKPFNWRVGAIYQATPALSPYVQYSTGKDPVGSNILLVNAGQDFQLSRSEQVEAGLKSSFDEERGHLTFSTYEIRRRNLLTQTSVDTVSNVGSQKSRGLELAFDHRPLPFWRVDGNLAYTDARYGAFVDTGNGVDASNNRPANVPRVTANLWNRFTGVGGLPLELGAGIRYIGDRFGDTANTLTLKRYTVIDLYAAYDIGRTVRITGRVGNAFNKNYAQWADVNYPTQVMLGMPRSYEVGVTVRF